MALRRLRVVVVPVWQRHWLFHAEPLATKTEARGWVERARQSALRQWETIKTAQPGTFQNVVRRVAERIVDQVPVEETFLGVVGDATAIDVVHPASLPAKLVRRRLRLLARAGPWHRNWSIAWGVATPLLFPLILSPVSNLPIVYTAWRAYSHRKAHLGANRLLDAPVDFQTYELPPQVDPDTLASVLGVRLHGALAKKRRWLTKQGLLPN